MSDIFLSYASAERDRARTLAEALQRQGWTVWWDRTIPPGRTFDEVIVEAIDDAKCVIVLWSQASVTSEWVKNEAAEGRDRHILVPVLIDDVKIPFEFRRIQAARLVNWDGLASDPEFDLLVKSIGRIIGPKIESVSIGSIAVAPVKETVGGPPIAEPSRVVALTPHAERASSEAGSEAGDLQRRWPPTPAERMGIKFWHFLLVLIALVITTFLILGTR